MTAATDPTIPPKRHGRRKLPDARGKWVHVRCNDTELATISAAAAQRGLATGAYLRSLALGSAGVRARRQSSADEAALARLLGEVGKLGSNVNQIARALNMTGRLPPGSDLAQISIDVQTLRAALMQALGREA